MRKVLSILSILLSVFILSSCSEEEVQPEDRLQDYVNYWNDGQFNEMYNMLSDDAKNNYPTEQFVDRYEKVYQDLEITNVNVTFDIPDEETDDEEITSKTLPIHINMDSIAGPITFDYEATMVQQEIEEDKYDWFLNWNPGFIFPELSEGGEIGLEFEQPIRGQIFDRNHFGLAVTEAIFNMGVVPERFGDNPDEEKQKIAEVLEMDVSAIDNALNADWVEPHLFVPLKVIPTTDEYEINKLLSASDALTYQTTTGRIYPYGEATAHLIGYVGKITAEELEQVDQELYSANDVIGKRGLEQLFEERLKGNKGVKIIAQYEDKANVVIAEKPVEHGETINLTIDAELQEDIYQNYEGEAGTTTAINPKTGETLALVSSPAFDPNKLAYGISQSHWDELQEDPKTPLVNRFAAKFSPGSTFKPITSAIGLNLGVINPDEGMEINGLTWGKDDWGNYKVRRVSESSGPVDLSDALIRSDNIYFARKAIEIGNESFVEGLTNFGFNQELPFAYPIQQSTISATGEFDRETLLADSGYGQGELQMSSLHLATLYTAFLNDGDVLKPTLETDEATGEIWIDNATNPEHAQLIKDALRKVVSEPNGTARGANDSRLQLSGKTGTAELKSSQNDEDAQENGWFVAYPNNEEILIATMVENTQVHGGSGYVVDKVKELFDTIFQEN